LSGGHEGLQAIASDSVVPTFFLSGHFPIPGARKVPPPKKQEFDLCRNPDWPPISCNNEFPSLIIIEDAERTHSCRSETSD